MFPGALPTKGRLLVATPPLEDPHFDRTVVFVLEHHDDGAIGVVINRPSIESLDEPLDRWIDLQSAPSAVFSGGPVEENALIALAETTVVMLEGDEHLSPILGTIASADLSADPAESKNEAERQPERVAQLSKVMDEISARDRDAMVKE